MQHAPMSLLTNISMNNRCNFLKELNGAFTMLKSLYLSCTQRLQDPDNVLTMLRYLKSHRVVGPFKDPIPYINLKFRRWNSTTISSHQSQRYLYLHIDLLDDLKKNTQLAPSPVILNAIMNHRNTPSQGHGIM